MSYLKRRNIRAHVDVFSASLPLWNLVGEDFPFPHALAVTPPTPGARLSSAFRASLIRRGRCAGRTPIR